MKISEILVNGRKEIESELAINPNFDCDSLIDKIDSEIKSILWDFSKVIEDSAFELSNLFVFYIPNNSIRHTLMNIHISEGGIFYYYFVELKWEIHRDFVS